MNAQFHSACLDCWQTSCVIARLYILIALLLVLIFAKQFNNFSGFWIHKNESQKINHTNHPTKISRSLKQYYKIKNYAKMIMRVTLTKSLKIVEIVKMKRD